MHWQDGGLDDFEKLEQQAAAEDAAARPASRSRPSMASPEARPNSPKGKSQAESLLLMGENLTPLPKLSALALQTVFGKAEAGRVRSRQNEIRALRRSHHDRAK